MQQAGVAVFVSRVRVFAGGADSGQFSKENSPPPKRPGINMVQMGVMVMLNWGKKMLIKYQLWY